MLRDTLPPLLLAMLIWRTFWPKPSCLLSAPAELTAAVMPAASTARSGGASQPARDVQLRDMHHASAEATARGSSGPGSAASAGPGPGGCPRGVALHQLRTCVQCGKGCRWRRTKSTVRTVFTDDAAMSREGASAEKEDVANGAQETQHDHTCAECFAEKEGINIEEAIENINGGDCTNKHIVLRITYQKVKMHVQVEFNFLGLQSCRKR